MKNIIKSHTMFLTIDNMAIDSLLIALSFFFLFDAWSSILITCKVIQFSKITYTILVLLRFLDVKYKINYEINMK